MGHESQSAPKRSARRLSRLPLEAVESCGESGDAVEVVLVEGRLGAVGWVDAGLAVEAVALGEG